MLTTYFNLKDSFMHTDIDLSVIIPAYLEEENLRIILPRLQKELTKLKATYEVLVVDTIQAKDNSKDVCIKNNVKYINTEPKIKKTDCYGDAIQTGLQYTKGRHILFMDADGSHPPEFIHKLYKYKEDYDVVIASRYVKGGATDNNKLLIFMSLAVNVLYSIILGLNCKDVSNGFKLYKADLLKKLNLKCSHFDIVEEILFKLKKAKKNLKIKEIPFTFKKRMFGSSKRNLFLFILAYIVTIIKLRFGK
jgi:dolichol-phosphate mannosyltransferase